MSLTVTNYTITGTKKDTITLPKALFDIRVSPELMNQAVRVYLSNQRQNTKAVQGRSDVNRTTAKVWRQKGTGRARHGSRKAPTFVGGGQAHGPSGEENYTLTLTKRMRQLAIKGALTTQQQDKHISTIETIEKLDAKTKAVKAVITKIAASNTKILLILDAPHQNVLRAIANVPGVSATQAKRLNVYELLNANHLIISKPALKIMEATYGDKHEALNQKSETADQTKKSTAPKKPTVKE